MDRGCIARARCTVLINGPLSDYPVFPLHGLTGIVV